jgi:hypothetical protein
LTFREERIAEVWFKPEGQPSALVFRIPRSSFLDPGIGQRLTAENLLKAVGVAADEVESWRHGGASRSTPDESELGLTDPLPPPPPDATHLEIHVRLKPPPGAVAGEVAGESAVVPAGWDDVLAEWNSVLILEASIDTLRISMEGLRTSLEAAMRGTLTADERVHALAADVAQWNKAKNRCHYALPKVNEFIHRATWAAGTPERKRLGEVFKNSVGTQPSLPPADEVVKELELLRKDRQVLAAKGQTVYQECKAIATDIESALRRLQSNAAAKASQKKGGTGAKRKSF